jgi:hypothetical protein
LAAAAAVYLSSYPLCGDKGRSIVISVRKVSIRVGFDGMPPFITKGCCHIAALLLYLHAKPAAASVRVVQHSVVIVFKCCTTIINPLIYLNSF